MFSSDLLGNGWHSPEVISLTLIQSNFSLTHFELLFKPQINISLKWLCFVTNIWLVTMVLSRGEQPWFNQCFSSRSCQTKHDDRKPVNPSWPLRIVVTLWFEDTNTCTYMYYATWPNVEIQRRNECQKLSPTKCSTCIRSQRRLDTVMWLTSLVPRPLILASVSGFI